MPSQTPLPTSMLRSRKAKPCIGTKDSWWYVNRNDIEVLARVENNGAFSTTAARLTRKQLERALELMDSVRERQKT